MSDAPEETAADDDALLSRTESVTLGTLWILGTLSPLLLLWVFVQFDSAGFLWFAYFLTVWPLLLGLSARPGMRIIGHVGPVTARARSSQRTPHLRPELARLLAEATAIRADLDHRDLDPSLERAWRLAVEFDALPADAVGRGGARQALAQVHALLEQRSRLKRPQLSTEAQRERLDAALADLEAALLEPPTVDYRQPAPEAPSASERVPRARRRRADALEWPSADDDPPRAENREVLLRQRRARRRGLVVLTLALSLAGLAALALRPKSFGEPELPEAMLLVRTSSAPYAERLGMFGFNVKAGTMEELLEVARSRLPGSDARGVAAILELADHVGYALVALEDPASLDLSGIELAEGSPPITPDTPFAVISVGDYARPHRLTVSTPRSPVLRDPALDVITAALQQEALAFVWAPRRLTDEVPRAERFEAAKSAVRHMERAETFRARIEFEDAERVRRQATRHPPQRLGGPLDDIQAFALADGAVLVVRGERYFASANSRVTLATDRTWRFECLHPEAGSSSPEAALSLMGGAVTDERMDPIIRVARTQDTILIQSSERGSLWAIDREAGPCHFKPLGALPPLDAREDAGVPHASGRVVRVRADAENGAEVRVFRAGEDRGDRLLRARDHGVPRMVWLDAQHLAFVDTYYDSGELYLVAEYLPDVLLRVELQGRAHAITAVAPAGGTEDAPELLVANGFPSTLRRVTLPRSYVSLFSAVAASRRVRARAPSSEPAIFRRSIPRRRAARVGRLRIRAHTLSIAPETSRIAAFSRRDDLEVLGAADLHLRGDFGALTWSRDGRWLLVGERVAMPDLLTEWSTIRTARRVDVERAHASPE